MKIGNISKVKYKYYGKELEFIGILVDENEKEYTFITENNYCSSIYRKDVISLTSPRGYPSEARELLKKRYAAYKEEVKIKEKIKSLNDDLRNIKDKFKTFEEDIAHAKGLLTIEEFSKVLFDNLSWRLQSEIELNKYEFDTYRKDEICLTRSVDIEKYCRNASFLYEDYDGTMHFDFDCEEDKNYKDLLRCNSEKIGIKAEFSEGLSLGDKDWLYYHAEYSIPLKKPLTQEYAKRLAMEIDPRKKLEIEISHDEYDDFEMEM